MRYEEKSGRGVAAGPLWATGHRMPRHVPCLARRTIPLPADLYLVTWSAEGAGETLVLLGPVKREELQPRIDIEEVRLLRRLGPYTVRVYGRGDVLQTYYRIQRKE